MEQPDLYSDSERCTLNADTFSELLVTYDPIIDNLKVVIKAIKEASFSEKIQKKEKKLINCRFQKIFQL